MMGRVEMPAFSEGIAATAANGKHSGVLPGRILRTRYGVSDAVCDAGGRLVALQRMNNAIWASAYGSQGTAVASAAFGRPSGELSEPANHPTPAGIAAAEGGPMVMGQGGVPVLRGGIIARHWLGRRMDGEGVCGGGTTQQDEDRAAAGVRRL